MQEQSNSSLRKLSIYNVEIDFFHISKTLWKKKLFILAISTSIAILTAMISLSFPNVYRTGAILTASQSNSDLNSLASNFSGVASIVGITLPGSNSEIKVLMGVEVMKSLDFFEQLTKKYNILIPLLASEDWDKETDKLIINNDIYDEKTGTWKSNDVFSTNGVPSLQSAHRKFLKNLSIVQSNDTGFYEISLENYSPNIAQYWVDSIIYEINETTRKKDIENFTNAVEYLEEEVKLTPLVEVRTGLFNLIKDQKEKIMIAKASDEYLFTVLSGAISPEIKSRPNRALITILSFILSVFLTSIFILLRNRKFMNS